MNGRSLFVGRDLSRLCLLGLGVALLAPLTSGVAQAEHFYTFVDLDTGCDLALVDTDAGTTTVIGSTNAAPEGLTFGPDGVLYATVDDSWGCALHTSANRLATIDPNNAAVTQLSNPIGFGDVDAIAFASDGTLYGVAVAGHHLITIDPLTGVGSLVATLWSNEWSFNFVGAIEFLLDGTLVGADMASAGGGPTTLLEINPSTGEATVIGDVGWDSVEGMSLSSSGRLFGMAGALNLNPGTLIEIDPSSAAGSFVQEVVADPWRALDGLAARRPYLVEIDIKPGSDPNCFNLDGHGVIPVAILGSSDFDASQVDPLTLDFEGLVVRIKGGGRPQCSLEDTNDDGYPDLVCQFEDAEGDWTGDDVVGRVTGTLNNGTWFYGADSICLKP